MICLALHDVYVVQLINAELQSIIRFGLGFQRRFWCSGLMGVLIERLCHSVILARRPVGNLIGDVRYQFDLAAAIRTIFFPRLPSGVRVTPVGWVAFLGQINPVCPLTLNPFVHLAFALLVVLSPGWWLFLKKPLFGLNVRASRQTAIWRKPWREKPTGSMQWTFGLGSGIAGMPGVAVKSINQTLAELRVRLNITTLSWRGFGGVSNLFGNISGGLYAAP